MALLEFTWVFVGFKMFEGFSGGFWWFSNKFLDPHLEKCRQQTKVL